MARQTVNLGKLMSAILQPNGIIFKTVTDTLVQSSRRFEILFLKEGFFVCGKLLQARFRGSLRHKNWLKS